MGNIVEYNRREAIGTAAAGSGGGGGGGAMDDILRRLGNVEAQVSAISATIPHLATAASVAEITAILPHLATKAELKAGLAEVREAIAGTRTDMSTSIANVRTDLASMETKIIKWIIATTLTVAALAFTIAKFVH
jgi:hypothetical protein